MKRFTMAVVIFSLMALGVGPATAQSGHDLFQQALLKERAEGELGEAIQLYEQIVRDFAADRTLTARALVQMGQCYEKLGSTEAERAYQTVVRDFADQPDLVAQAEARLAVLVVMQRAAQAAEIDRQPTFRRIEIASRPQNGVLSPDGTTLAFASGGSLWLVPIHGMVDPYIAGEPVRLTEPMGVYNLGNSLAWSGNGEWIAFNTRPDDGPLEIHVISSMGGETMQVPGIQQRGATAWNYRISLSPEGKRLAFTQPDSASEGSVPLIGGQPEISLYTMPVEGGEAVLSASTHTRGPAYSPDGRFLAFVRLVVVDGSEAPNLHSQVWIRPVDGGAPILVADSIRARGPVWSPDSRLLAFIRETYGDATGGEVWVVSVAEDGQPVGAPNVISLPRENLHQISGWTPDDELAVFMNSETRQALYTVPVEGGRAVQITPNGYAFHPRWKPDGEAIVYRGGDTGLATVSADGGESTEIKISSDPEITPGIPGGGLHVSPDGRRIVFMGYKNERPLGVDIWTVPVEGGPPTQVTDSPTQDRFPCWGPDGESIAFLRYREVSERGFVHNLYLVPSAGGEPRAITVDADSVEYAAFAYSPDGNWLAYFSNGTIKVRPAEGGESRIVAIPEGVGSHSELAWSPDGRRIAYTGRASIWITSVDGGEPVEVRTGVLSEDAQNLHIDWSPDGERIVFSASMGGESELWMISDFLR